MPVQGEPRPRLSIEITQKQRDGLDRHLGRVHGLQKMVFGAIIDDLLDVLESQNAGAFIAALVNRQISLTDFVRTE